MKPTLEQELVQEAASLFSARTSTVLAAVVGTSGIAGAILAATAIVAGALSAAAAVAAVVTAVLATATGRSLASWPRFTVALVQFW